MAIMVVIWFFSWITGFHLPLSIKMSFTGVGLVSLLLYTTQLYVMRILQSIDTSRVRIFEVDFVFDTIRVYTPSKNLHT